MKRILLITGILTPLLFSYAYPSETVRYLLAVGANNGGEKRELLRFAVSDAQSFSRIMNQLGGIPPERTTVLIDPRPDQFAAELTRLGKQIAEESRGIRRTEIIFYYSGHSDEEGLLLGSKSFEYKELRDLIHQLPADVKIAILDSCSSGAFTRIKGGKKLTPFMSDASQDMRGFAFMTSSSADEVSQESDRIGGSFFTYYLISGLRGAADGKRDGQITLNEAYQYAYRETLTRTARTAGGAQHPNYNIQMTGTGDVILTDIRAGGALLTLGDSLDGRFFVNSGTNLVAEFTKQKGDSLSFSLAEGRYSIVRDSDGSLSETKCILRKNATFEAWERSFTPIEKESSVQRGVKPSFYSISPFAAYLLPLKGSGDEKNIEKFQIYFIGSQCSKVEGVSVGIGVGVINEQLSGVSLSAIGSVVGKEASFLQAATVFTYTGSTFSGVQAAGVCAFTGGDFKGVQGATAVAYNGGNFKGVQSSGILNMTAGHFSGLQTSSAFNFAGEGFSGMQASVVNYSGGGFSGFQLGVGNIADTFGGFQLGVANLANDFGGFQLGVANYAGKEFSGFQLGVFNIINKFDSGLQIGVINYCDEADGYPIGIITIVRNGETHANVVMEENGFMRTTLTHGTRKFYNIYSAGYRADSRQGSTGLGFGRKFESGNLFFAVEGIANSIVKSSEVGTSGSSDLYNQNQLKLTVGYMFFSHLSVFAGVSVNHYLSNASQREGINPPLIVWENSYNKIGPGFYFGVRF